MKNKLSTLLIVILASIIFSTYTLADSKIQEIASFKALHEIVLELGKENLAKTLLVMDDDDTLTMMSCPDQSKTNQCQYLGGPAWYNWQDSLLETQSEYRVANTKNELLEISALLFAINDMPYTEQDVPRVLNDLSKSGVRFLVETARGSETVSATSRQFTKLSVKDPDYKNLMTLIQKNALTATKSKIPSIASPYIPHCKQAGSKPRLISYQQGVIYVAGQDKGKMLQCLLKRTESSSIKNIIFIDDTLENVIDVATAFESSKIKVKALHYTALTGHKNALTTGSLAETFQKNAKYRWEIIKGVLGLSLQKPAIAK